jgi:hypothetical protein
VTDINSGRVVNIYLDDIRTPPSDWDCDWKIVLTAKQCIRLLQSESGKVDILSLDHDLGEGHDQLLIEHPGTGYDVAVFLEEQAVAGNLSILPEHILCHSANPVGRRRILQAIDRIEKYRKRP